MMSRFSRLRLGPWLWRPGLLFVLVAVAALLWANRYRYDSMTVSGDTLPVRIDRVTGKSEVLYPGGWESVGSEEAPAGEQLPAEQLTRIRILGAQYRSNTGFVDSEIFNGSDYELTEVSLRCTITSTGRTLATRRLTKRLSVKPGFSVRFLEDTNLDHPLATAEFELIGATGVFAGSGSGKQHPPISFNSHETRQPRVTLEQLGRAFKQEYPGQFDDQPDYDLGLAVRAEYPDDFAEVDLGPAPDGFPQPTSKDLPRRKSPGHLDRVFSRRPLPALSSETTRATPDIPAESFQHYESTHGFSIGYPAGWRQVGADEYSQMLEDFRYVSGLTPNDDASPPLAFFMEIRREGPPKSLTVAWQSWPLGFRPGSNLLSKPLLDEVSKSLPGSLRAKGVDATLMASQITSYGENKVLSIELETRYPGLDTPLRQSYVSLPRSEGSYVIAISAPVTEFERERPVFEKVLGSFRDSQKPLPRKPALSEAASRHLNGLILNGLIALVALGFIVVKVIDKFFPKKAPLQKDPTDDG